LSGRRARTRDDQRPPGVGSEAAPSDVRRPFDVIDESVIPQVFRDLGGRSLIADDQGLAQNVQNTSTRDNTRVVYSLAIFRLD
jgi:hypothetical protein